MSSKIFKLKNEYKFKEYLLDIFSGCTNLERLHEILPEEHRSIELVTPETDNSTWFHKKFYEKINLEWPEFINEYKRFLAQEIVPVIGNNKFIYQAKPTFRVQVPNNKSVGDFHRDYDYNHPLGEINFVIPITDMNDTTAIWTETIPGLKDFYPINVKDDSFFAFNGNMCLHGNKINLTQKTRVSFDFRVLPISMYDSAIDKKSITYSKRMIVGEYYESMLDL